MGPEALWLIAASAVIALVLLGMVTQRDRHLTHISRRYVERRPTRAILIIVGLLLSTALIVIATIVNDTLTLAVQREAVAQVGRIEEVRFRFELVRNVMRPTLCQRIVGADAKRIGCAHCYIDRTQGRQTRLPLRHSLRARHHQQ